MSKACCLKIVFALTTLIPLHTAAAQAVGCKATSAGKISGKQVWKADTAIVFKSPKLEVDADGAPNSYLVDGKGLSYTCDGSTAVGSTPKSDPKHWQAKCLAAWAKAKATGDYTNLRIFGFQTGAKNVPLIQQDGDPLPKLGYISTTSVAVTDGPAGTQRHWVDATKIPYVVLSGSFVSNFKVGPGDVAVVYRPSNGQIGFAVYGDGGDLGESSVMLHKEIGNDPVITSGGVERAKRGLGEPTVTLVFSGRATKPIVDADAWNKQIQQLGQQALTEWGGVDRLKACAQ